MWSMFAIFCALVSLSLGACTNICEHGVCVNSECKCNSGWMGRDCSIYLRQIASGDVIEQTVAANHWDYYVIAVTGGKLQVVVAPASSGLSDCDLFLKYNSLPSPFDYDERDTGWGSNAVVTVPNAVAGEYYIGVYGSSFQCHYHITATSDKVSCIGGCSGRGMCITPADGNAYCQCTESWVGPNCEFYVNQKAISVGLTYTATMQPDSIYKGQYWSYFFAKLDSNYNKMNMVVNATSSALCTFLVDYNLLPTENNTRYMVPPKQNFLLSLEQVTAGPWYIGAFGPALCSFTILLNPVSENCPGSCSERGQCGPPCSCNPGFTGDYCQTMTDPLALEQKVNGFVDSNLANWYKYAANTNDYVVVHMLQHSGDCDIYVRADALPTPTIFDEADITKDSNVELYIPDALQSTLYIAVYGFSACRYTIYITLEPKNENCGEGLTCMHGNCGSNGTCVCAAGWIGTECDTAAQTLHTGLAIRGQHITQPNEWQYYTFTMHYPTLLVSLREVPGKADPTPKLALYLSESMIPTLTQNDYHTSNIATHFHSLTLTFDEHAPTDFPITCVIGVYASPLLAEPIEYNIVGWEPNF